MTGMWVHRLGLAKAKYYALTGEWISGKEARCSRLLARHADGPVGPFPGGPLRSEGLTRADQAGTIVKRSRRPMR